jgi:8-oxo-dGTP pyrophosphatase MutT (NUDIX family)
MPEVYNRSRQAAVVAISGGKVCLVTSSSGRRWTLPKGTVEFGHTEADTAGREAWEEAGLRGRVESKPILQYSTEKWGQDRLVAVFRMHVTGVEADWPERDFRTRRWFTPEDAMDRLTVPGQRDAVRLAVRVVEVVAVNT